MKIKSVLGLGATAAIMLTSVWLVTHQQNIVDWWRLRDFEPSPQIQQLVEDSGMSEEGERLFYIHAPELLEKSQFQGKCDLDEETIVLGCYITNDKIYVFNVDNKRLDGIEEVTAAHEMLHAAYDRITGKDKDELDAMLLSFYSTLDDARLTKTVESYRERDESIVANELHSILGTEIRNLSSELEKHYAKYFDDRVEVVKLAEDYEAEFTDLENRIKDFDIQLETLGADIKTRQSELEFLSSALQAEQQQLDALISSPEEYNNAVPSYNQKVREYNGLLNQLRGMIEDYNRLVEERNSIAVEEQDLIKSIDSNYIEL